MTTRKTTERKSAAQREPNIFEKIEALGRSISDEQQARAPLDGARNLHHYLDGAPKQDHADISEAS